MYYLANICSKIGTAGCEGGVCQGGEFGLRQGGFPGPHHFFPFEPLLVFLFLALVVALVIKLFAHKKKFYHAHEDKALELLKERYVKGEISSDEFTEMKKNLLD